MNRDEIGSLVRRARRSFTSARNLLEDADHDFAISRAYFAMFHAATAALLVRGVKRSKHSGVIAAFGQHLVRTGEFSSDDQKALLAAFRDRTEGDYSGAFPAEDEVERRIDEATQFVGSVEIFLKAEGFDVDTEPEPSP